MAPLVEERKRFVLVEEGERFVKIGRNRKRLAEARKIAAQIMEECNIDPRRWNVDSAGVVLVGKTGKVLSVLIPGDALRRPALPEAVKAGIAAVVKPASRA